MNHRLHQFLYPILWLTLVLAAGPRRAAADDLMPISASDLREGHRFVERVLASFNPPASELQWINYRFDSAFELFEMGNRVGAVRQLRELALSVKHGEPLPFEARLVASLKARVLPEVFDQSRGGTARVHIGSMYAISPPEDEEASGPIELALRITRSDGILIAQQPISLQRGTDNLSTFEGPLLLAMDQLEPGRYDLTVESSNGYSAPVGSWLIVRESLLERHQANQARLDALDEAAGAIARANPQARASCRARNDMLIAESLGADGERMGTHPTALADQVATEIDSLEQGVDPYTGWTGDLWRVLRIGDHPIPLRVYAPTSAVDDGPVPMVIALHGAWGDERMFMSTYGDGVLKKLADQHKFILVAPNTTAFGAENVHLDLLISEMRAMYDIDPDRIYMIGHSTGTVAVMRFIRSRSDRLAAVCTIGNNGLMTPDPNICPWLLATGMQDAVTEASRTQSMARVHRARGMPVQFLGLENRGHTLVVGDAMPTIVDWLLQHRVSTRLR